jgi:DNA-binding CsgD family transcriptional regulator
MKITKGDVRKHISNICLKFNLDSNSSKRVQLTRLISLHRPELLESKKVGRPITRDSNEFTEQQIKVLNLFIEGKEDKEIATSLDITEACVRKHIERVYKQLGERHKEFSVSRTSKHLALTKLLSKERSMLEPESNNESLTNELVKRCPFYPVVGRVEDSFLFYGRTREVNDALQFLNSGANVCIVRETQVGKSSLVINVEEQLKRDSFSMYKVLKPCLYCIRNEKEFYLALCDELGIEGMDSSPMKGITVRRALQRNKFLVVLDSVDIWGYSP